MICAYDPPFWKLDQELYRKRDCIRNDIRWVYHSYIKRGQLAGKLYIASIYHSGQLGGAYKSCPERLTGKVNSCAFLKAGAADREINGLPGAAENLDRVAGEKGADIRRWYRSWSRRFVCRTAPAT